MNQIIDAVRAMDGALVVIADGTSGFPEAVWGDACFFSAPDGMVPARAQPVATIASIITPAARTSVLAHTLQHKAHENARIPVGRRRGGV